MPRAGLTDKDIHECRQSKQDAEDNGSLEECLLKPSARVETGAEVVSTESTPKACSGSLQEDRNDEEDRESDLHVWQYRRDFHGFKVSERGEAVNLGLPNSLIGIIIAYLLYAVKFRLRDEKGGAYYRELQIV